MFCGNCGKQMLDSAAFCPECGAPAAASNTNSVQTNANSTVLGDTPAYSSVQPTGKKKVNKKLLPIIAIAVAICLVVSGIAVFASTTNKPLVKIGSALKDMLESGDTYELAVEVDGETVLSDVAFNLNAKSRIFSLEMDIDGFNANATADLKENSVYVCGNDDGLDMYIGMNLEELIMIRCEDGEITTAEITENDEDMFFMAMDVANAALDIYDGKDAEKIVEELMNEYGDLLGFDLDDLESDIDPKVIEDCGKELIDCLLDTKWLEENMDFEKSKEKGITTYEMTVSAKTIKALFEVIEPVFAEVYEAETGESFEDEKDYLFDILEDEFPEVDVAISLAKDYIKSIEIDSDYFKASVEIEESDKDIAVDTKDFDKKVKEAKKLVDEDGYYSSYDSYDDYDDYYNDYY